MLYMQSIPSGKHGNTINTVFWFSSICHANILRLTVSAVLERPHKLVTKLCKYKAHFQSLESSHRFNQRVYSSSCDFKWGTFMCECVSKPSSTYFPGSRINCALKLGMVNFNSNNNNNNLKNNFIVCQYIERVIYHVTSVAVVRFYNQNHRLK